MILIATMMILALLQTGAWPTDVGSTAADMRLESTKGVPRTGGRK